MGLQNLPSARIPGPRKLAAYGIGQGPTVEAGAYTHFRHRSLNKAAVQITKFPNFQISGKISDGSSKSSECPHPETAKARGMWHGAGPHRGSWSLNPFRHRSLSKATAQISKFPNFREISAGPSKSSEYPHPEAAKARGMWPRAGHLL